MSNISNNNVSNNIIPTDIISNNIIPTDIISNNTSQNNTISNDTNTNTYTEEALFTIKQSIEALNNNRQLEILKLLMKIKNITINENTNGTYINLTELNNDIINELNMYVNYIKSQESQLNELELEKDNVKNIYFPKDNKDILIDNNNNTIYINAEQ
jgi:hypothetical protein